MAAVRLLAILAGFVPWDGWDGWEVHKCCFFPPGFSRGGISPGEFQALVFWRQQVREYKHQNAALRARLAALEAQDLAPAGQVSAFPRAVSTAPPDGGRQPRSPEQREIPLCKTLFPAGLAGLDRPSSH